MSSYLYGRNPAIASISGPSKPTKVLISSSMKDGRLLALAKQEGIPYELVSNDVLDKMSKGRNHQGVICLVSDFSYTPLEEVLKKTDGQSEATLLILDGVEDPVNFGSLIRSSACFNADGLIIGKNRQVQVTPTVIKVATGAEECLPIVSVVNISQTLETLKKHGYWIVAADGKGDKMYDEVDYSGKIALIIGSEGRGISRLVLDHSDFIARIPISGPITSLNAAVSGAIFLAMIVSLRNRRKS